MPLLAWMLLFAAPSSVELVNQTFLIPANDWRFVDLGLRQRPAQIQAEFDVQSGPPVRLLLMERPELDRLNRGETHAVVASTRVEAGGHMQLRTSKPADYVVVVENRSGEIGAANVRLRVAVDFVEATQISPQRQLTVIAISFTVFFGIAGYSARRLWRVVRR
jgi:hypothetical protein